MQRRRLAGLLAVASASVVAGPLAFAGAADAATTVSTYHADGTALDSTSTHHGTWSGTPAYTAGLTGQAFSLNGAKRIVMDQAVGRFGRDIATISFSLKTTSGNRQSLVGTRAFCDNPGEGWWDVRQGPNQVSVEFGGDSFSGVGVTRTVNDGQWHDVVIRRTATQLRLTLDGVTSVASAPASNILSNTAMGINTSPCINADSTRNFVGALDELVVKQESDADGDGIGDDVDNCLAVANAGQADLDADGTGDACDPDIDGDGVVDSEDAFPTNPGESVDTDGDGTGNNADSDDDNDGVADAEDAFPRDAGETTDTDSDGTGNNADTDDDNDGVDDADDAFPLDANEQLDTDGDGAGNIADGDDDGDGVSDSEDAFPLDEHESIDTDGDGDGNNADSDDDGDGIGDADDRYPLDPAESTDSDGDGTGNNADPDDDNDGVADSEDAFPTDRDESVDTDGDGNGNNADSDDDGDGVSDGQDAFPLDEHESIDTDGDGTGNNADPDDDNDGVADNEDRCGIEGGGAQNGCPLPTSNDQCKKDGWRNYGTTFMNQGDCGSYVATRGTAARR
jgi:hypothetical protein